jgi:hypothetical protein
MPFFDKKGNMVDIDKANLGEDFPKLEDLDDLPKIKRKKLLSLPDRMSMTSIVLAVFVVVTLVVIAVLALKINSLNKEVMVLSRPDKRPAKRKHQPAVMAKKPTDQKKKQVP